LAGFNKVMTMGAHAIELDVHLSSDNEVVVYHDYKLKPDITRNKDGSWLGKENTPIIKNLTVDELKMYDVGRIKTFSRYAMRYPDQKPVDGERIPTLNEILTLIKRKGHEKNPLLWVEIKTTPVKPALSSDPIKLADGVIRLIRDHELADRVYILSFDWRSLLHVQKSAPLIPTVFLTSDSGRFNTIKAGHPGISPWTAGWDVDDYGSIPQLIKAVGGSHWAPRHTQITADALEKAQGLGMKVHVWTVDEKHHMIRLIEMGVDGIITNRPDRLKAVLSEHF
jgi:glycerophosphoryl diester phosphodiesterase